MAPPNAANALDARLDVRTRQTSAMGLKGCLLFTERPDGDTSVRRTDCNLSQRGSQCGKRAFLEVAACHPALDTGITGLPLLMCTVSSASLAAVQEVPFVAFQNLSDHKCEL
eukprot:6188333-Pleurochrysis_carterae.AAC.4